jgi:Deoxyribonuclease II
MPQATQSSPGGSGSAVVKIAAVLPLAIALTHAAVSPSTATTAAVTNAPFTPQVTLAGLKCGGADSPKCAAPYPMLQKGHPVDWWFVFKFNAKAFPGCGTVENRACPFGGDVQSYPSFGQQFAYASSETPVLQPGTGCAGAQVSSTPPTATASTTGAPAAQPPGSSATDKTTATPVTDPIGATFDEVYNGQFHYVVWNDQFYGDPVIKGCSGDGCDAPWGHSKGMVAWNDAGEGFVMQVSTPSWPGAGSARFPRKPESGNTLGCIKDNDVEVSQHFFALRLSKDDLVQVLAGLVNASVVTDPGNSQIVNNGGPQDVQQLVAKLGTRSDSTALRSTTLSTGVELISKPSKLAVPPWQMVSAVLGGISLRTATWWADPQIYSTDGSTVPACWSPSLGKPGAVEVATTGKWQDKSFDLTGGLGTNHNHAKLGVSTSGKLPFAIFGDMNQQGTLSGSTCSSSQNGRGGLFFAMVNSQMSGSLTTLISGDTAPLQAPVK